MNLPHPQFPRISHSDTVEDLATSLQTSPGVMLVGRSLVPEYLKMFGLDLNSLSKDTRIMDIASGVASFGVEMRERGFNVTSVDPLYALTASEIRSKAEPFLTDWSKKFSSPDSFTTVDGAPPAWLVKNPLEEIATPGQMLRIREAGLQKFIEDFEKDKGTHYIASSLPELIDLEGAYGLILCGNYLMAYTSQNLDLTVNSIKSMSQHLSKNGEIRIYPGGSAFEGVEENLKEALYQAGLHLEVIPSEHRFVKGWDAMYRITKIKL